MHGRRCGCMSCPTPRHAHLTPPPAGLLMPWAATSGCFHAPAARLACSCWTRRRATACATRCAHGIACPVGCGACVGTAWIVRACVCMASHHKGWRGMPPAMGCVRAQCWHCTVQALLAGPCALRSAQPGCGAHCQWLPCLPRLSTPMPFKPQCTGLLNAFTITHAGARLARRQERRRRGGSAPGVGGARR